MFYLTAYIQYMQDMYRKSKYCSLIEFLYFDDILRLCNFYWMLIMCKGKRLKNKRQCQIQDFNFSIYISSTLHQISFSSPISCLKSFLIQILSMHSAEKLF